MVHPFAEYRDLDGSEHASAQRACVGGNGGGGDGNGESGGGGAGGGCDGLGDSGGGGAGSGICGGGDGILGRQTHASWPPGLRYTCESEHSHCGWSVLCKDVCKGSSGVQLTVRGADEAELKEAGSAAASEGWVVGVAAVLAARAAVAR